MPLEICKNGFVDILFRQFAEECYYDEDELRQTEKNLGVTIDTWISVTDINWSELFFVYNAYVIWKSTDDRYGYVSFSYNAKEEEGRKHHVYEFDGPYQKSELIEAMKDREKYTGLLNSLSELE